MQGHNDKLEDYFTALVDELSVPAARYEQASRSYKAFGDWLHRGASTLIAYDPDVYLQGSFKLGTVIRPHGRDDEYDVDAVCLLNNLSKGNLTQSELKAKLKAEVVSYHAKESMTKPIEEKNRCWRLSYADGAQFHMDLIPAIPNANDVRKLLEANRLNTAFADTAIAITCMTSPTYRLVSGDWPRSNPKGYAAWFVERMGAVFIEKRRALFESASQRVLKASVEDIPVYEVRTPLQSAIMLLKHHRDTMFADDKDERKPISIILTTLAAHAYQGERTIVAALHRILKDMDRFIGHDGTKRVVKNPTDPLENFADKWEHHPERQVAFFEWLEEARKDFLYITDRSTARSINEHVSKGVGQDLGQRALARASAAAGGLLAAPSVAAKAPPLSFKQERRPPEGPKDFG